jgi:hypothetical protein
MSGGSARALLLGLAGVLVLVLVALGANAEVVDKQVTLDYTTDRFWRVRFFDSFEVLTSEDLKPDLDTVNALLLFFLGGASALASLLTRRLAPGREGRLQAFFGLLAVGAVALGLDELLEINESVAANLGFLDRVPLLGGRGNLDLVSYVVPTVVFLAVFWRTLLASRRALVIWAASLAIFAVALALDVLGRGLTLEDAAEPLASAGLVAGLVVLAVERLGDLAEPPRSGQP